MYKKDIEPNLEEGNMLMFAHGFNIHFGHASYRLQYVDVTMIAPKGPGHTVRSEYQAGKGCSLSGCCTAGCTPARHWIWHLLMHLESVEQEQAFWRLHSVPKPRQTSLVSRLFSAVVYVH